MSADKTCPRCGNNPELVYQGFRIVYDAWHGLNEVLEEFGLNPKARPHEAQAWLREKLACLKQLQERGC